MKRVAIIDIGSNSMRMVVYERTSRYGFHLVKEVKSKVRLGEGAYEKEGYLQEIPMQRAYETLDSFLKIKKNLNCNKIFCVATSALRDAPNSKILINKVKKNLNLSIKIIDGKTEACFGAVSAICLLEPLQEATTIDIGGGSTELSKIVNGKITQAISLDIGTVRLKELFFDKKDNSSMQNFTEKNIQELPKEFISQTMICLGGTARAISNAIMESSKYPLKTVHGFKYDFKEYQSFIQGIIGSSILDLKSYYIKRDRFDTIKEGSFIFYSICKKLKIKKVLTCGAGVREGVFLSDILRKNNSGIFKSENLIQNSPKFPANFNPSVKSLTDRFAKFDIDGLNVRKNAIKIFDALQSLHNIEPKFKLELSVAAKLNSIGRYLSAYQEHLHGFYFVINNLNFGFSHKEKTLIALLIKSHGKKLPLSEDMKNYQPLLPKVEIVNWLSFILALAKSLELDKNSLEFRYTNHTLYISKVENLLLVKDAIKALNKPVSFAIAFD